MNLFYLDKDPAKAAQALCDRHIVKMPTEAIQMLVSALNRHEIDHAVTTKAGKPHRGGYANHPMTRWVGDSSRNFVWCVEWTEAMLREHAKRYPDSETHAGVAQLLQVCEASKGFSRVMDSVWTPPPRCFSGFESRHSDPVMAHREYYATCKRLIATWTSSNAPDWFSHPSYVNTTWLRETFMK